MLTDEQVKEGYSTEESGKYVLVWHNKNQIALLANTPDIDQKVHKFLEKHRAELKAIEEKYKSK